MFKYWSFRYKAYHHSLKLWLENIKQTSIAIVALFPLAMPALVFIPFVFLGIILKPDTSAASFFNTLWGYLLLLYTWVSYQRKGILGLNYSHYMASLPVSKLTKIIGDIGVTLYVANFFVLAPLFLCIYALFNFTGGDAEALEVIVSMGSLMLLAGYYCCASLRFKTPWLSLFVFPVVITLIHPDLAKFEYTVLWVLVIMLDHVLKFNLNKLTTKSKGLIYLFLKWESQYTENNKLILVVSLLILSISKVIVTSVAADVSIYFLNFSAFLFGVVLAANLFSVQKFKTEHQAFLTTYPISNKTIQFAAIKYTLAKLLLALVVLYSVNILNIYQWMLFAGFYIATTISIIKWPTRFILSPVALVTVLVVANIVIG